MTKEERQALILELLMQHDSILVTDLATHLNVSSVTIRKDLTDLEREKKLYRNHGKAILIDPYIDNRNVSEKEKLYVEEKRLIGMKAANLIAPKECTSANCAGEVTSGFLVGIEKADVFALAREYPEAFGRDYDPDCGLVATARVVCEGEGE